MFNTEITNKWPQMIVSGKSLTIEQVCDIYLKTETMLNSICVNEFNSNSLPDFLKSYYDVSGLNNVYQLLKSNSSEDKNVLYKRIYDFNDFLSNEIGVIDNEFVLNDWVNSSFVFGAHGWCNPDGSIKFIDNIGKYPDTEEVVEEWETLVKAFPYLDINVTIMSDEQCVKESQPLFNIRIIDGKVSIVEPDLTVHNELNTSRDYSLDIFKFNNKCELNFENHFDILANHMFKLTSKYIDLYKFEFILADE